MQKTIHIYHTNDLHSHLENWPRIHQFLKERRAWHEGEGEDVFIFDLGDHVDRSHSYTEGTMGRGNVKLLNEAGYDAATIGNNEGITLPKEELDGLYAESEFDVIVANLFYLDGTRPEWAQKSKVYQTADGLAIGVTAATAYYSQAYRQLGWNLSSPVEELKAQAEQLSKKSDILIILSHLGIHDDEKLAEELPAIDIVIGAHTHHLLHEGKEVNGALLAAAGKFGYYIGHIELTVDLETRQIVKKKARVYETNRELDEVKDEGSIIQLFEQEGKAALKKPVVKLQHEMTTDWFEPSELPQLLCEALTEWCEADCSFLNAGVVTKYDLHRILPHPINPCAIELSGTELKEVIKQTFDEKWPHLALKGLGFRGKVLGSFVYDRIEADFKEYEFKVNGQLIEEEKIYRLATLDMFTYGHFFTGLFRATHKQYYMPEFLRDIMEWKLQNLHPSTIS